MLERSAVMLAAGLLTASLGFWPSAAGASAASFAAVSAQAAASAAELQAARSLADAGDIKGAITGLATYVAANPADIAAAKFLGDLDVRAADWKDAQAAYLAVLVIDPGSKEVHDRLGNVYAAEDLIPQAIAEYKKSLPDAVAYADLVRLHRRLGDLDAFVASYRKEAEDSPTDPLAQYGYGLILRDLRRPADALTYLLRAVDLAPRSCPVEAELGNAYLDLNRTASARASFHACLALDPNYYPALIDLSDSYDPVTESAAARGLLQRAIALRPDRPEAFVDLGFVEDANGEMTSAIENYQNALARDVLCRDAYVNLGYDYQVQHQFLLAEAAFLKGLSVSPSDGRLEFLLGATYVEQGKRDLARQEFANAARSEEPDVSSAAQRLLTIL